jgi:hypothetical protein
LGNLFRYVPVQVVALLAGLLPRASPPDSNTVIWHNDRYTTVPTNAGTKTTRWCITNHRTIMKVVGRPVICSQLLQLQSRALCRYLMVAESRDL